jgi:two-component system, OmpR family, response regulator
LPDGDGLQWLQRVRARGDPRPVIAITARDQIGERIRGLRVGADDYLVKPFDLDEMLARIDAVARRLDEPRARAQHHRDVTIDFTNYRATRAGAQVEFTAMEWSVLRCLAQPPRRIWSRTQIEVTVAGHKPTHVAGSNSLEVIVSRLRKKLGDELISTHRGLGYRLED